jgi:hypothetical protein
MTDALETATAPGTDPPPARPGSPRPTRGRRAALLVVGGAGLVVLLATGVVVGSYLLRDRPGAKSVDQAVDQFRAGTGTTDAGPVDFVRPVAGVYTAAGSGNEQISKPPNAQHDGDVMPISVTYLADGCWTWHIDYNSAHWHEFDFCPQGGELLLVAQRNYQAWDFGLTKIENVGTYACDPPAPIVAADPTPGAQFQHHCTGDNTAAPGASTSEGPATIVGAETLSIGGTEVATIHQKRAQTMSGAQRGGIEEDWWYAADTGLPVRCERSYRLDTDSVIGTITYTESGSWQLTSMEPRT